MTPIEQAAALWGSACNPGYDLQQRIDMARDVHDGVVQRLFGVSMALDSDGDFP